MKKLFLATLLIQAGVFLSAGAPAPIFINNSPLTTPPQVDATVFWNRSTIDIFTQFPYQAQNVQFWTNNGIMNATPGFLIEYDLDGKRAKKTKANSRNLQRPATTFFNDGNISAGASSAFVTTLSAGSVISINAKNVMNSGRLDGTESGLIKILATNGMADLARGEFRVGPSTVPVCDFLPFAGETNFIPNAGITDLYWGAGVNNALGTNGQRLNLNSVSGFLSLPFPQTPIHEVRVRGSTFTNRVSLPGGLFFGFGGCSGAYDVFVHTNNMGLFSQSSTTMLVNIVFVPTNSLLQSSNLAVDVRFASSFDRDNNLVYAPVVQFRSSDFDIVEQQSVDSYVTFMDNSAAETNIVIARPFLTGTTGTVSPGRRPNSYNIVKGRFCSFDFSEAANSVYDPTLFFRPENGTNVVDTIYAAYSAEVGQSNAQSIASSLPIITGTGLNLITGLGVNPALSDPSNFSGRVEINADRMNLGQARIRAENFVSIKANDLTSNQFAQVDAPFIDFQVKSTNSELVIDNLAPDSVNRLSGSISAWSSVWNVPVTNVTVVGTNTNAVVHIVRFHVLLLDSCLQSVTPVTLNRFSVTAPSLIIRDNILVNGAFSVDTKALSVDANATLALPVGRDMAFTNVHNLRNFTNDGTVSVQGGAYFGTFDSGHVVPPPKKKKKKKPLPPTPLDHFVNRGALAAATLFVRATNAEISSAGINPATVGSASGVISFVGSTLVISNATVTAGSDMELHANDLLTAQSFLSAGRIVTNFVFTNIILRPVRGGILIDATNSFGDFGPATSNLWRVTGGIRISTRPARAGDLIGTHVNVAGGAYAESPIVWAGEDRGPVVGGYANNLALGRLTLDGAIGNLFHFSSAGGTRAIYVDYLELLNSATNYNFALGVDSNFTIYFADANIPPEKLDQTGGGRIRWVRDFTGPQSSTRITYPNGVTYTFNSGLVRSKDLDSDGDGIVNADDCTPIIPPGEESNPGLWFGANCPAAAVAAAKSVSTDNIGLTITLGSNGRDVLLNWNAAANSANVVEFTDSIAGGAWQSLTNFINGPVETRVTVKDAVDAPLRVYRVRVDAVKP